MTRTRCLTFSIIPRVADVSSKVDVRWSLLSLSPISVWRCFESRRIGEPVCSTVTVCAAEAGFFAIGQVSLRFRADGVGIGGVAATGLEGRNLQAAPSGDRARAVLVLERIEGGANEVVG